eukprot:Opistho-1_new@65732
MPTAARSGSTAMASRPRWCGCSAELFRPSGGQTPMPLPAVPGRRPTQQPRSESMMERREFSRVLTAGALAASGLAAWPALAQGKKPENGTDYLTLDKAAAVDTPAGKVEVLEFFWYSCPHCNAFEPQLESWIKQTPKDVVVRRVPVRFRADFEAQQRLYYTLEGLNKVDELHRKVFYAVHVEKTTAQHARHHCRVGRKTRPGQRAVHGDVQLLWGGQQGTPCRPVAGPVQGAGGALPCTLR